MVRADDHAHQVRHHESNPADDAADGDRRTHRQRGCRNEQQPVAFHIDSQRTGFLIAHGERVEAPAGEEEHHAAGTDAQRSGENGGPIGERKTAQEPVDDARQFMGIDEELENRNQSGEEGGYDHSRKHQGQAGHFSLVFCQPVGDE